MDERVRRIGLNEAVFREVNERIEVIAETFGITEEPLDLVCECGDPSCVQRIRMRTSDYEALRADPLLFAVYPGHETSDFEDVIEKRSGYDVVRKHGGAPTHVAHATDPRSGS